MTEVVAFGLFDLSPKKFADMADHAKAELCRLLLEAGGKVSAVARVCGVSSDHILKLAASRHCYNLEDIQPVIVSDLGPDATEKQRNEMLEGLPLHSCRLLMRIPVDGPQYWKSLRDLEMDAGMAFGHGQKSIGTLYGSNLVERAPPKRGYAQGWVLTSLGMTVRSAINPDDLVIDERLEK